MKTISLRPRQEKSIEMVREAFKAGNRAVIMQAATGFGKTRIAARIIQNIINNGKRVMFICDRVVLIEQALKAFESFDIPCGVIQAQHEKYDPHQPLQICSIQTLKNRRKPHADFVIVDEVHTVYKAQNEMIAEWDNVRFLGITATAFTKGLGLTWDALVVGARTQELIDDGHLTPIVVYGAPQIDLSKVKIQAGDYNQKQLGSAVDKKPIIGDIVKHWVKLAEDRQTICSAVNILHSKHIVEQFKLSGIPAAHIDCYTKSEEREEIYKDFENGKYKILSSVDILTKGFDAPFVSCVIMARPTKSLTMFIQLAGRGIRINEGKKDCIILDHAGNVSRHGFPTDPLPEILCNDEKKETGDAKKPEQLPKQCGKCFFMKPPKTHICPNCGHAPEKQNDIENTDDKLEKIEKVETGEKLKLYAMLLYYARSKGWSDGWSSHAYKAKTGVWPFRKTGIHPVKPDEKTLKYIQHLMIKNSRSKSRNR